MKKLLAALLLIPALAFGAANDLLMNQRNALDTGTLSRTIAIPAGGANGLLGFNGSTVLPQFYTVGQGLQLSGGVLASTVPAGPPGPQGIQGETGQQGPQGAKGDTGLTGLTGPTGATGPQGVKGDTGNAGATGATGQQGIQGVQGIKGDTGDTGPTGAQGPQGIQGQTGATGPASTVPGPQGAQGLTGATGSAGPAGAKGDKGDPGSQGPIGLTGAQGATGLTGATGATGSQGPQGIQGAIGANGATGPAGPGSVVSVTAGTGLSGGTITTAGTISLPNTGTAGSYNTVTTDAQGRVVSGTSRSFAQPARALNTAYQVSATQDAQVTYTVDISVTSLLLVGSSGRVYLEYADNSGMTTNLVTVNSSPNATGGVLNVTNLGSGNVTGWVPAGKWARIRTAAVSGAPTFTFVGSFEALQ